MTTQDLFSRTFAAVNFDNDGTLVDSTRSAQRSWVQWAREHEVDPYSLMGQHGMPASAIIEFVARTWIRSWRWPGSRNSRSGTSRGSWRCPGRAMTWPRSLRRRTSPRHAIATSAARELAAARLREAGIAAPAGLVAVEDVERGKPDPEPLLLAARRLGADPSDCLVCEDAPSGITAARAAGCAVLAVTRTCIPDELADADLVVESLAQVGFDLSDGRVRLTRR